VSSPATRVPKHFEFEGEDYGVTSFSESGAQISSAINAERRGRQYPLFMAEHDLWAESTQCWGPRQPGFKFGTSEPF